MELLQTETLQQCMLHPDVYRRIQYADAMQGPEIKARMQEMFVKLGFDPNATKNESRSMASRVQINCMC